MDMLMRPFNRLMLARYAGLAVIPVYEVALSASMQVRTILETGLRAFVPEVGSVAARSRETLRARILSMNRQAIKLIALFGAPMYAGTFLLAKPLLKGWLGSGFVPELSGALQLMLLATFLSLVGAPSYYTLLGLGRVYDVFSAHAILSGINVVIVVLALVLLHSVGILIVSCSYVAGAAVCTAYLWWRRSRAVWALT